MSRKWTLADLQRQVVVEQREREKAHAAHLAEQKRQREVDEGKATALFDEKFDRIMKSIAHDFVNGKNEWSFSLKRFTVEEFFVCDYPPKVVNLFREKMKCALEGFGFKVHFSDNCTVMIQNLQSYTFLAQGAEAAGCAAGGVED